MWLHTIILTLLFLLIPLGFGLFIVAMASTALVGELGPTRLQLIVLGITIGGPGTGVFLQLVSLLSTDINLDLGLLVVISLAGFAATRTAWLPRREDCAEIALWTALSVPLALMTWWASFGAFSNFPFGDLGADVHWIKTAQEYVDTGIINSYANQSYIDLRAALAGAFAGTLGLDLLQFDWTYRYFSILYFMVVFYAVADSVFLDPYRKWFAFFFAAAGNTLALLTNGSLAVSSSLVFLSFLPMINARKLPQALSSKPTLLGVGSMIFSILLTFFLNNNTLTLALLIAMALILNVCSRLGNTARNLAQQTCWGLVWPVALTLAHRGSYLFIPIVVAGWLFYIMVWKSLSRTVSALTKVLWTLALVLPLLCVCIVACVIASRLGYLPSMSANKIFSHVTLLIVGRAIKDGDEITLGAGPEIAVIEVGRAVGPLFAVGIGLAIAWWCKTYRPARLEQLVRFSPQNGNAARLLWSWVMGCALCLAVLSGFPFLYRIIFIITGVFAIATTEMFFQLLVDPLPDPFRQRRLVATSVSVATAVFVVGLYSFGWLSGLPYAGYQAMLRPMELAGMALVLSFAALAFTKSRAVQVCGLAAAVSLSVAIDRSGMATLFRVYSFGPLPSQATAVSHYDASDLTTARWLHDNRPKSLVISDPYTLGLAKAVAGAPGIYLFSNLDTVNRALERQAKAVISAIVAPAKATKDQAPRGCATLWPFLKNLNQEAWTQIHTSNLALGIFKPVRPDEIQEVGPEIAAESEPPANLDEILSSTPNLDKADGKWNVVAIINPRTIQWLHLQSGQRLSYYPADEPLKPETLISLQNGGFPVAFTDGQNAVILVDCGADTTNIHSKTP
jgi:hypothetical protein